MTAPDIEGTKSERGCGRYLVLAAVLFSLLGIFLYLGLPEYGRSTTVALSNPGWRVISALKDTGQSWQDIQALAESPEVLRRVYARYDREKLHWRQRLFKVNSVAFLENEIGVKTSVARLARDIPGPDLGSVVLLTIHIVLMEALMDAEVPSPELRRDAIASFIKEAGSREAQLFFREDVLALSERFEAFADGDMKPKLIRWQQSLR